MSLCQASGLATSEHHRSRNLCYHQVDETKSDLIEILRLRHEGVGTNKKRCARLQSGLFAFNLLSEEKVVDVDTEEKLDAGEHGEIRIKGPTCSPGYVSHSGMTEQLHDSEGFIRTGESYFDCLQFKVLNLSEFRNIMYLPSWTKLRRSNA